MTDVDKELLIDTIQLLLSWIPDCCRTNEITESWYALKYSTRVEIKEVRTIAERVLRSFGVEPLSKEKGT